jgi:hypothetical protein
MALLALNGSSAVNLVVLASAVVPPIIAIIVCRVAWIWAKNTEDLDNRGFTGLLRAAFGLPARRRAKAPLQER